ncbi:hypothetical protein MMC25_002840 [Agyrium rufum]|nr:hypothetical protein [Agyrium rufum]
MSGTPSGQGRGGDNDSYQHNMGPPFYHIQPPTPQERPGGARDPSYQQTQRRPQGAPDGTLNMASLAGALPNYASQGSGYGAPQQNYQAGNSAQSVGRQMSPIGPFAGQAPLQNSSYNMGFQSPFGLASSGQQAGLSSSPFSQPQSSQHSSGSAQLPSPFGTPSYFPPTQQQQQQAQYMYYPSSPFGHPGSGQQQFQGREGGVFPAQRRLSGSYGQPTGFAQGISLAPGQNAGLYLRPAAQPSEFSPTDAESQIRIYYVGSQQSVTDMNLRVAQSRESSGSSTISLPSSPRGPPRKPKQSGHALWVGNLPPGAQITDLKDHFSRDATNDIESVFLISKSNCAFVNYRSEEACAAAMSRFHDSRFQGVRLVCRLRRSSSTPVSGAPTGPAALGPSVPQTQTATESIARNREVSSRAEESVRQGLGGGKIEDKYFVVKSLTVEDLEVSARNGIWATQSHNEAALNKAFETTENVYLIFSANKSGEYFGYARMVSAIDDATSSKLEWKPRAETVVNDPDVPRSIPTQPTEHAPKGRIIDDSARGTIFWEADPTSQGLLGEDDGDKEVSGDEVGDATPEPTDANSFGKPFKIEWVSTNRLPFYRTRGLRNPWNANREVKIARDGTELETSVGRRLVQMFHRSMPQGTGMSPIPGQMDLHGMRSY